MVISKPLFHPSKTEAVNSKIYTNEFLVKRLLPFIRNNYPDSDYIYWPDLIGFHYSKLTVAWMDENVKFVSKRFKPPNVPQAQPIENFWGCFAQKSLRGRSGG